MTEPRVVVFDHIDGEVRRHDQGTVTSAELARLRAQRDRYGEALEEIRDTDPVDNALDPQRAARIAAAALGDAESAA